MSRASSIAGNHRRVLYKLMRTARFRWIQWIWHKIRKIRPIRRHSCWCHSKWEFVRNLKALLVLFSSQSIHGKLPNTMQSYLLKQSYRLSKANCDGEYFPNFNGEIKPVFTELFTVLKILDEFIQNIVRNFKKLVRIQETSRNFLQIQLKYIEINRISMKHMEKYEHPNEINKPHKRNVVFKRNAVNWLLLRTQNCRNHWVKSSHKSVVGSFHPAIAKQRYG